VESRKDNPSEADLTETGDAMEETVADVELEDSLDDDSPMDHEDELELGERLLAGFDPEAHHQNIRDRQTIKKQVMSEGGQFVLGLVVLALGLGVLALAATIRSTEWYVIAGLVAPPALLWFFLRWKRWLAGAPYAYRLLTSLGEDAENILSEDQKRAMSARKSGSENGSE